MLNQYLCVSQMWALLSDAQSHHFQTGVDHSSRHIRTKNVTNSYFSTSSWRAFGANIQHQEEAHWHAHTRFLSFAPKNKLS